MTRDHPRLRSLAWLVLLAIVAGCGSDDRGAGRVVVGDGCPDCSVILISIDTLRPDHLGVYGYPRDTSPTIDALAADGILFRQAIAQAPSTLPSHASLFTSLLPSEHGALFATRSALDARFVTLAEVLAGAGFQTAAFHAGGQLAAEFGVDQGFERYTQEPHFVEAVAAARAWLETRHADRFFLFVHTYDVHHPYAPPAEYIARFEPEPIADLPRAISIDRLKEFNAGCEPWLWPKEHCESRASDAERAHIVNRYDALIRKTDDTLGGFVRFLRESGLYDRTLIVLTSDHGEEFGEHGMMGWHAHSLYDELLRIPLIVKRPRSEGAGTVVEEQVRSLDVAPTILSILDVGIPEAFRGVDLVGWIDAGALPPLLAVSQRDAARSVLPVSIRSLRWKLFDDALFDLRSDPGEHVDLATSQPRIAETLAERRSEALAGGASDRKASAKVEGDTEEQLRALGYVD